MAYPKKETIHYTLGKGELVFQEGETYTGKYRDLGNSPAVNLNVEVENLEHYSSRVGAKEKDGEATIQKKANGNFQVDDPNLNNIRLFFLGGDIAETVQEEASDIAAEIAAAGLDTKQQIKDSSGNRLYNLTVVVVKDETDVTTYTENDDYEIDYEAGLIRPLSGGSGGIVEDDELHLTCNVAALNHYKFRALEKDSITGHVYFNAQPPKGKIQDFQGYCKITASGDLAKIGEDWQQVAFDIEFLNHSQYGNKAVEIIERGYVT